MRRRVLRIVAVASALAAGIAGGYAYRGRAMASPADHAAEAPAPAVPVATPPAASALPDFSGIVQRYGPAVVNVSTTGTVKTAFAGSPFEQLDPDDPFYEFFRHFRAPERQGRMIAHGLGSGFIVKPDGTILTNAHVVAGANERLAHVLDRHAQPAADHLPVAMKAEQQLVALHGPLLRDPHRCGSPSRSGWRSQPELW